jgi:carboxypeptidase Taq
MTTHPYAELETRFGRMNALSEAGGVLNWDMATLMPAGGADARSEQLAAISVTCHQMMTDPQMAELFEGAEAKRDQLDGWQAANLQEMRRQWLHATAVPERLVEQLSRATNRCELAWRKARPASDFQQVKPYLQEVLELTREAGQAKAEALNLNVYDALLDQFEPGFRAERIDAIFGRLAQWLPETLPRVLEAQRAQEPPRRPEGPFPQARQEELGRRLMQAVGFDFHHGRLDVSLHPFCGGVPDDLRITTRYDESDFTSAIMGVLHETGHAMYERGLPGDWRRQPVGEARGMALHESQSLLVEMQACRSADFLRFMAPIAQETFAGSGPAWDPHNLYRLATQVEPGFIRVDADEVTYPAHVILRYRLETALIHGDMSLDDLPAAWNEGMQQLLGITPPEDRLGCLQDIHWFDGAFGYFPTYTLGALAAAQLFEAATTAHPEIPEQLRRGDFTTLLSWLQANVHGLGSSLDTDTILERATGSKLDEKVFQRHIQRRYLDG